jgi:hypothetical protein
MRFRVSCMLKSRGSSLCALYKPPFQAVENVTCSRPCDSPYPFKPLYAPVAVYHKAAQLQCCVCWVVLSPAKATRVFVGCGVWSVREFGDRELSPLLSRFASGATPPLTTLCVCAINRARLSRPDAWFTEGDNEEFQRDFKLLFWSTYRKGMPQIGDSKLTSDSGWGCMIRSAQMMVAHALQRNLLSDGAWGGPT